MKKRRTQHWLRGMQLTAGIGISLAFFACAPQKGPEPFSSLTGQGIIPLSGTNPYLGSNLFLAHEAEMSPLLYQFLEGRGGPTALELERNDRGVSLILYYLKEREVFVADREMHTATGNEWDARTEWLVRGPFPINRKDYRALSQMRISALQEPTFVVRGLPHRFHSFQIPKPTPVPTPIVIVRPAPTKKPVIRVKKVVEAAPATPAVPATPPPPTLPPIPMNTDQRAIAEAQGFASRAPNGDIAHKVAGEGEKLKDIASWYTGNAASEAKLREVNGLVGDAEPAAGAIIVVPAELVKNPKKMGAK